MITCCGPSFKMESHSSACQSSHIVQKHWRATQERVEKFLSDKYFTDVNLQGRLYPSRTALTSMKVFHSTQDQSCSDVMSAMETEGREVLGKEVSIGPSWSTHWFKCVAVIPVEWAGRHVRFRWDCSCEAMIWINGKPVQGLTGSSDTHQLRTDFILSKCAKGGESYTLYVEAAANGMFGVGKDGMINPPDPSRYFQLGLAEISVFDQDVYDLINDLTLIIDMAKHLPRDWPRAYEALYTANEIVNQCEPFNKDSFHRCKTIAREFLSEKNGDSQHVLHVMGYCHIDSAWLWPYSESRRKCGRSWSSAVRLMDDYPQMTFVCSQAQQLQWVKEDYPSLYQSIKEKARNGQFVPAGGTWIEMDGNIPSGESFVRQFLLGQRFFKQEFGHYCKEFWLPDTFGYSAQLPQVMSGAGITYFLSQKLSWNLTNEFPHNSFIWEGLDGSSVLAHFPPADTYESPGDVADVAKSVRKFKDKGRTRSSVLLYGHGDGGGGPTEAMMESLSRMENVDGLPRVKFSTPEVFFSDLAKRSSRLCKWVGELYLELHRGTYTTHAQIKKENRQGEFLLHDLDLITALSFSLTTDQEKRNLTVRSRVSDIWKKFLLNQFHDVLPGSCIKKVADDALEYYNDVKSAATAILEQELLQLLQMVWKESEDLHMLVLNSFCWNRRELVHCNQDIAKCSSESPNLTQNLNNGTTIGMVECEPMSVQPLQFIAPVDSVLVTLVNDSVVMENINIKAIVSRGGLVTSLLHKPSGRDCIVPGCVGNQFVMFDDVPLFWDAWDVMEYHHETRKPLSSDVSPQITDKGPLRAAVEVKFSISDKSCITQVISLDAESSYLKFDVKVSWHESHKFLKVEFPFNVRSHEAQYEIQFGHLSRPTHYNTSWDQAKFEVCAQKWASLSEHGFGVALINDCKYGYSTLGNVMRLSLLRSSKAPDECADMGTHCFSYAVLPYKGCLQDAGVVQTSYEFNKPLSAVSSHKYTGEARSFFKLQREEPCAVFLETVKPCEEAGLRAVVIRLYEAFGSHASVNLATSLPITKYQRCNLLEEPIEPSVIVHSGIVPVCLKPFEIASYILYF